MSEIDFDVETCSEKYKEHIREAKYGDTVYNITNEKMIFIHKDKKYIVTFVLEFDFDFENGFNYTSFSDFKSSRKINNKLMSEFEDYIKKHFVTTDRLSC